MIDSDKPKFANLVNQLFVEHGRDINAMDEAHRKEVYRRWWTALAQYSFEQVGMAYSQYMASSNRSYFPTEGDLIKFIEGDEKTRDANVESQILQIVNGGRDLDYFVESPHLRRFLHDNRQRVNQLRVMEETAQTFEVKALVSRFKAFKNQPLDWYPKFVYSSLNTFNLPPRAIGCTPEQMKAQLVSDDMRIECKPRERLTQLGLHCDDVRRKDDPKEFGKDQGRKVLADLLGSLRDTTAPPAKSEAELIADIREHRKNK